MHRSVDNEQSAKSTQQKKEKVKWQIWKAMCLEVVFKKWNDMARSVRCPSCHLTLYVRQIWSSSYHDHILPLFYHPSIPFEQCLKPRLVFSWLIFHEGCTAEIIVISSPLQEASWTNWYKNKKVTKEASALLAYFLIDRKGFGSEGLRSLFQQNQLMAQYQQLSNLLFCLNVCLSTHILRYQYFVFEQRKSLPGLRWACESWFLPKHFQH